MSANKERSRSLVGLFVSGIFMVFVIPYTLLEYFDRSIPFDNNLLFFSAISIVLFAINFYYYRKSKEN